MIFPSTYFPQHSENRMKNEGNVELARKKFLESPLSNLEALLFQRFNWMNDYINKDATVIELGSGAGFLQNYIYKSKVTLTDIEKRPWINLKLDALNMSLYLEEESVDVFICSHMVHHLARPKNFFEEISRFLKPGGKIIIQDLNNSYLLRLLLRIMKHEGWSYDVDIFNKEQICNAPNDPWSANCAIPQLLFKDKESFEKNFPQLKIKFFELNECLIFPISGGVISKTFTIPLPKSVLKLVSLIDKMLCKIAPKFFALGMSVVIQKEVKKLN